MHALKPSSVNIKLNVNTLIPDPLSLIEDTVTICQSITISELIHLHLK